MPESDLPPSALQHALGAGYVIERELGGGGMSRVFVARDAGLDRRVVVKLLPAELTAAMSAERFRREIQLAARLQHPHIVPLLAAGDAGGTLYYTMPFVEGSSLRARLEQGGALPVAESVRLLREVASALGYAHRQGLVHRDVKPENVLLSDGHALVTDFGIAKALSAGALPEAAPRPGTGLTAVGTAIGTPAYMAPEQGVGDPSTDHRADLYAFGVVAYELLAGAPPFGGERMTPHQLLVAHMTKEPVPLAERRPDIPAALAALVSRCLAKQPEDRPQTAEEIVQALDAIPFTGTTTGAAAVRAAAPAKAKATMDRRVAIPFVGAMLLIAGVMAQRHFTRAPGRSDAPAPTAAAAPNDRVLVVALANETGDRALEPVGRMAADWLTRGFAQTGIVKLVDVRTAAPVTMVANGDTSTAARSLAAARTAGAGLLVTGQYYRLGDSLQFALQLVDVASGEIAQSLDPVKGAIADPTPAMDTLRRRALGALAPRFDPRLAEWSRTMTRPPTYESYQLFSAGIDAFQRHDLRSALTLFDSAARLDTSYAQPRLWMLEVYESAGLLGKADTLAQEMEKRRTRMSPLEQAQLDEYATSIRGDIPANLAASFRMHQLAPGGQFGVMLSRKLLAANRPREAWDTLQRASLDVGFLKGTSGGPAFRGTLLHQLGRHEEELAIVRDLRKRFPDEQYSWAMSEAVALGVLGRNDELSHVVDEIWSFPKAPGRSPRGALLSVAAEISSHGKDAAARAILDRVLASLDALPADSARMPAAHMTRGLALYGEQRWVEARTEFATFAADTAFAGQLMLAITSARAGDTATARRIAARLASVSRPYDKGGIAFARARVAAALGDREGAVALMRQAESRGTPVAWFAHNVREFQELKGFAPYDALVRPRG